MGSFFLSGLSQVYLLSPLSGLEAAAFLAFGWELSLASSLRELFLPEADLLSVE